MATVPYPVSAMRIRLAATLLASLVILTACQESQTPSTTPNKPTESVAAVEPAKCNDCMPVTADNFIRAETDRTFYGVGKLQDGFSKFRLFRVPTPLNEQTVPRVNRDTLYSVAVFDLD